MNYPLFLKWTILLNVFYMLSADIGVGSGFGDVQNVKFHQPREETFDPRILEGKMDNLRSLPIYATLETRNIEDKSESLTIVHLHHKSGNTYYLVAIMHEKEELNPNGKIRLLCITPNGAQIISYSLNVTAITDREGGAILVVEVTFNACNNPWKLKFQF